MSSPKKTNGFSDEEIAKIRGIVSELQSMRDTDEIMKLWKMVSEPTSNWNEMEIANVLVDACHPYIPDDISSSLSELIEFFPGEAVKKIVHEHPMHRGYDECWPCDSCGRSLLQQDYYECRFCSRRVYYCIGCADAPTTIKSIHHMKPALTLTLTHALTLEDILPPLDFGDGRFKDNSDCSFCGGYRDPDKTAYHCSTCHLYVHPSCARSSDEFTVSGRKLHEHKLKLLPFCISFTCDACGLAHGGSAYICLPCRFMVHARCTFLPGEVKITRHRHRLSHTFSRPLGEWPCGVCFKTVDENYGAYSCKENCSYAVHSNCLYKMGVWDGIDVQGQLEETDNETPLYERIDDKSIRHLSHKEHDLQLNKGNGLYDDQGKLCRACILPINSSSYFSCTVCSDFILHETCANLARRKQSPIHVHPLTLEITTPTDAKSFFESAKTGLFKCLACSRLCNGFYYQCAYCDFKVDVRCASILDHGGNLPCHAHVLVKYSEDKRANCNFCHNNDIECLLKCSTCSDFFVCFKCATLPSKLTYKFDEHPLELRYYSEDEKGTSYWCELCEHEILPRKEFPYECDDCSVTVHVACVFGEFAYMKPGQSFKSGSRQYDIVSNNHPSRPICKCCGRRCQQVSYLKGNCNECFCSWRCCPFFV